MPEAPSTVHGPATGLGSSHHLPSSGFGVKGEENGVPHPPTCSAAAVGGLLAHFGVDSGMTGPCWPAGRL